MIDIEMREFYKSEFIRKDEVESEDVKDAVANIYQSEIGFWYEDEAYQDLWHEIDELYEKHQAEAKDHDELVDRILSDLSVPSASNDNRQNLQ